MPNSNSPKTSPPRLRERLVNSNLIQQLTANIAAHTSNPYYIITESSELGNFKSTWETESQTNPWDDEATISANEETNHDTAKKSYSVFQGFNILTNVKEQLVAIRNALEYTPETEEEYEDDDEPPMSMEDGEFRQRECDFRRIPKDLICDERTSFMYSGDGYYQMTYVDDELIENIDYDDINPSTSKRALEKLFILQTSMWMNRPNIEYVAPTHTTTAVNKLERQQLRQSYDSYTL